MQALLLRGRQCQPHQEILRPLVEDSLHALEGDFWRILKRVNVLFFSHYDVSLVHVVFCLVSSLIDILLF